MRKQYLFIFLTIALSIAFRYIDDKARWVVLPGSNLHVNGSTNINNFACEITDYLLPDTLICNKLNAKGQVLAMRGKMDLAIADFDCHNKMMTNDLRKTLKYKEFPNLTIQFISLNSFPDFRHPVSITGVVDISLAGVKKRFDISYLFTIDPRQQLHLKGARAINFTDFNLTPPSKMGGIIKAKDLLNVEFNLNLKSL